MINGGLNFRQAKAFREANTCIDPEDQKEHDEDVLFTTFSGNRGIHCQRSRNACTLPSSHSGIRRKLSESTAPIKGTVIPRISVALGMSHSKIVDCIMYDSEPILKTRLALLERIVYQRIVVERRISHSRRPKDLQFHNHFPNGHPKVTHVVVDEFPETPSQFGAQHPWEYPHSRVKKPRQQGTRTRKAGGSR